MNITPYIIITRPNHEYYIIVFIVIIRLNHEHDAIVIYASTKL